MNLYYLKDYIDPHLFLSIHCAILTGISIFLLIKMYKEEQIYFKVDKKDKN